MSNIFSLEKILIFVIIGAVIITGVFLFYLFFSSNAKGIELKSPNAGEELSVANIHTISWKTQGIERVGIVLFKGKEPKWIAQNIPASDKEYEWRIYPGQEYGDDYWIAVFEYPWIEGNEIDFSDGAFAIVYPDRASCEGTSVNEGWPHLPSDFPNLRKVFVTEASFNGDLAGLEGADRICQDEAKKQGLEGIWHAFLGGDTYEETALERLKKTPRAEKGIYVSVEQTVSLIRGATCHRVLGKDFNDFLNNFSNLSAINKGKLNQELYDDFKNVWLGRIKEDSRKNCVELGGSGSSAKNYSLTATCQNWTNGKNKIEGDGVDFPSCYSPSGAVVSASSLGGLSSGIMGTGFSESFTSNSGEYCNASRNLVCIEE